MPLDISSRFAFTLEEPSSALLQFEAATLPDQAIVDAACRITGIDHEERVPAQDGIGERVWLHGSGRIEVQYEARIKATRALHPLKNMTALPLHHLPGEAVQYLFDSRYCRSDEYQGLVDADFDGTTGGTRIAAIRDWIFGNFTYSPGVSDASTDATASFIARAGVCRDYTHVLVMLARASAIPARYVACYAAGVTPQDFHAVAQVFLADQTSGKGAWHMVDATGMADLSKAAIIGVGRDAADVSFLTSFGPMTFEYSKVDVASRA